MRRLLVFLLAALALTACSDQLDIAEQKMQEIAGEYLVTSISDRHYIYLPEIPAAERESFQHARLAKSASEFVGGPGVTEGLCLDFILSRTMSFVSGSPEFADTAIRIKVFGGHFWSLQQQGLIFPTLNVGIGFHFDSRPLSRASRP